jgi:mRNA-degrading endonuclease RelE of RelBE toxin-antitoxin system
LVRLIFHPAAKAELRDGAAYYQARREGLGEEFLEEVRKTVALIRRNPLRCSFISRHYRCCRVRRFPYGVVYRVDDGETFVAAVMHFKRKPGYWSDRK